MLRELKPCSEALKHAVHHVLVEYMHPLHDLVYCLVFFLSLFKYASVLSHSLFYLLGEAPLSLLFDSDLKILQAQMSYSVLMHDYAIS